MKLYDYVDFVRWWCWDGIWGIVVVWGYLFVVYDEYVFVDVVEGN